MIQIVPANEVYKVWLHVMPLLERTLKHCEGQETIMTLLWKTQQPGGVLVLIDDDGAGILEKIDNSLHGTSLAGDGMIKKMPAIIAWWKQLAKDLDCTSISINGRKGWAKVFKQYGFVYNEDGHMECIL